MALSKLEIQQMLREMNVKFNADDSYEALKHRLQQENHSLWLKSVSGKQSAPAAGQRSVIRKKRKPSPSADETTTGTRPSSRPPAGEASTRAGVSDHGRKQRPTHPTRPIDKPIPGQHWKSAADGTQPFNRTKNVFNSVLKRAKNRCERCSQAPGDGPGAFELHPHYILPLSQGGQHSIKNMVALCPECREAIEADPDAKEIKELKRKTRSRLYDSLQVVRKKRTPRRNRRFRD